MMDGRALVASLAVQQEKPNKRTGMTPLEELLTKERQRRVVMQMRLKAIDSVLLSATGAVGHDVALSMLDEIGRIARDPA